MKQKDFLALLEPLEPKLFGFAYRMLRCEEHTKDAMQELKFRLWKKRKELNTHNNISAYCFRAINNICIDQLRYQNRLGDASLENQATHSISMDGSAEQKDLLELVRKAVQALPYKQRVIIELHDFQQFNHAEIAEMLEIEVNAVRVNLSRARAKIVAQFRKEEIYD